MKLVISLGPEGRVVAERVLESSAPDAESLVQETLVAAGESTFVPERRDCRPVGGEYVFVSQYAMR